MIDSELNLDIVEHKKMLRKKNNDWYIFLKSNFKSKILKVKSSDNFCILTFAFYLFTFPFDFSFRFPIDVINKMG